MSRHATDTAPGRASRVVLARGALVLLAACAGSIGDGEHDDAPPGGMTTGGGRAPGAPTSTGPLGATTTGGGAPPSTPAIAQGADPGRVAIHRLNNAEYDSTMRDLLGVPSTNAPASFIPDEKLLGFDTIAEAFGMTDARYEQYFEAATALADQTFANPTLRARILTCTPAADATCARTIVKAFGLRAWRRPLETVEVDRLVKVAADAAAAGEDFAGSLREVVRVMLAAPQFLYRIEPDADPASTTPRRLDPYSLASRLSYLVWGTMPDDQLFRAAASGELVQDGGLAQELDRLLASPRAGAFVSSFGGQWLGLRALANHQVEPTAFPDWDEPLRKAMIDEGLRYFRELLDGTLPMAEFFTADVNFVDARLARHYGLPAPAGAQPARVAHTTDRRRGFLGLGSYLTNTSFSYRTSPTLRGNWVLENLLCSHLPPPPANVPELDGQDAQGSGAQSQNVRVRLEQHRRDPGCAGCHNILDPIGLGLESFDGIGRFRTKYPNGDAVSSAGVLPDGSAFDGLEELAAILARDARFGACVSDRLMTYALSRELRDADRPYLEDIRKRWTTKGGGVRALLAEIVLSDPFRFRRGETAP